jgi:hypothetical protein
LAAPLPPCSNIVGKRAVWLFDRGFDAADFYTILRDAGIHRWVVRQLQTRNVILETGITMLMSDLAAGLLKPFDTQVPYVDKKTHKVKHWPVSFNFVPVRFTAGGSFDGLAPFSSQKKGEIWGWDITATQSDCLGIRANCLKTFFRTRQKWFLKKRHRNHRQ